MCWKLNKITLLHESLHVKQKDFKRELWKTLTLHTFICCVLFLFLRVSYTHLATREFSTSTVPNPLATRLALQIIKILVGNADN